MHCCGDTEVEAWTSQWPSLCLPPNARAAWVSLQGSCELWLTHQNQGFSPNLQLPFSDPSFPHLCPQSLYEVLHSIILIMVQLLWALTDTLLNSGSFLLLDFYVSYWDVLMSDSGCTLFCFSFMDQMVFLLILHFCIGHPILEVASLDSAFYHKIYFVYHLHTMFDKGL